MSGPKVQVKKVSPYPIEAELEHNGLKIKAQIVKLSAIGFLLKAPSVFKVGIQVKVTFRIPASSIYIVGPVKIMKTYDQYKTNNPTTTFTLGSTTNQSAPPPAAESPEPSQAPKPAESSVERMAEMHFLALGAHQKESIETFLRAIKQVR